MNNFLKNYNKELIYAIESLDWRVLEKIANLIIQLQKEGHTAYLIGNGGSAATPSHSAGDWTKELKVKSICLTDNTPSVTAFANDTDYSNIFKGQLEIFLTPGDILIAYSGSGNSKNIINAIEFAKSKGIITIGITGNYNEQKGGILANIADISLIVNSSSMERIEDIHLIVNHILKEYIKSKIV